VFKSKPWFGVEVMANEPSAFTPSQAQPEPNRVMAASLNFFFISSTEPKVFSISSLSYKDDFLNTTAG
jgi:hypothetical protein